MASAVRGSRSVRVVGVVAAILPLVALLATGAAAGTASGSTGGTSPSCKPGPMPFAGIKGAHLTPSVRASKDAPPVRYVFWQGLVPSFDGLGLSVDVTVPCAAEGPGATVVMAHGFTDDKTVWEETGKSDTVDSEDRPGSNSHWNNIWFASRGYTVLTYTARGWHDSCGPDTPDHSAEHPAPQCAGHQYWIHLDDQRWEVRDAQWLTGGLVQSGIADPDRLAITGGSYGGGPTSMSALLGDRVVCGGDPVPAELGADPCKGKADGTYAPWTTPDGEHRLTWAAALPLYTFADLIEVLAPNGRWSDGWEEAPPPGDPTDPFGVPLESTLRGLILAAQVFGSLAPPGTDPTSDIKVSSDRLLAGNPFDQEEAVVRDGIEQYRRFKSPVGIEPQARVPIFWVQGLTDALFPANQALIALSHVRHADPHYPFKLFLGDIGHDYAAERTDEWKLVHVQMNDFIDHYLDPERTPAEPAFDVGATVTRCLDHDAPLRYVHAASWDRLHPTSRTFRSTRALRTSTSEQGPNGAATDPISTATLPGPNSYKGCRITQSSKLDPTVATYEFPVDQDLTVMGAPVVRLKVDTTGADVPFAVRVWDVDPKAGRMGLVTRGIYRMAGPAGRGRTADFQLFPQGYRFPRGHRIRVEVTANDSPYFQASNIPADVTVRRMSIVLPLTDADAADRLTDPAGRQKAGEEDGPARSVLVGAGFLAAVVLAAGVFTWARRRRPARAAGAGSPGAPGGDAGDAGDAGDEGGS